MRAIYQERHQYSTARRLSSFIKCWSPLQQATASLTLGLCVSFGLSLLLYSGVSWAEKPEIMLLIDASSSMERLQATPGYPSGCEWPRGGEDPQVGVVGPGFSAQGGQAEDLNNLSRIQWAQWQLAGAVSGPLKCVGHDAGERDREHAMGRDGFIAHYRLMCQAKTFMAPNQLQNPNSFVPCGADHGRRSVNNGVADPDSSEGGDHYFTGTDGFIQQADAEVYFGLMVSDSDPKSLTDEQDPNRQDWSYGDPVITRLPPASGVRVINNIPALSSYMDSFAEGVYTSAARDPRQAWVDGAIDDDSCYLDSYNDESLNLGIRGKNSPNGRFIVPKTGHSSQPDIALEDDDNLNIIKHNLWVAKELRKTVPHGPSPLSAMLSDLHAYYEANPAECQTRLAILVTDGAESTYLPTRRCNRDRNCDRQDLIGKCVEAPQVNRISHERFISSPCQAGMNCDKVCVYPEGTPYEGAVHTARSLHDELNVPVLVALVGHPSLKEINYDLSRMTPEAAYAYKIAEAGSPELGPAEGVPGIYNIEDLGAAIDLINRLKATSGQVQQSETQPLVIGPGLGDAYTGNNPDLDLRQMRIAAYGFTPPQDDKRYSDVTMIQMGCSGAIASPRGLKVLGEVSVNLELARQRTRPVFTVNPSNGEIRSVVDGNNPLFREDGEKSNNDYRDFMGPQSKSKRIEVGLQLQGYFGARGLDQNDKKSRQFGGITAGDITALPPTGSARENSGDPDHYREKRERPNLFFFGGDDGMVHAVRAFDGYNLFSFVPFTTWRNHQSDPNTPNLEIDGPISAGELITCRSSGGGGACPSGAEADVKSMVIGGTGGAGRELFGFEVTQFTNNELRDRDPNLNRWPNQAAMWSLTHDKGANSESDLGYTVSRPALAHVNFNGEVKGVAIIGCGKDPDPDRNHIAMHGDIGRCLLFIEASTGKVLHKVEGPNSAQGLRFPVVGAPSVYPNNGNAAEVVYFGDIVGQVFRLDLNNIDPNQWELTRVWPLSDAEGAQVDFERGIGHSIFERPSLSIAENGDRVVIFATGELYSKSVSDESTSDTGYMVSLRERFVFDNNGTKSTITEANWVLDFAAGEHSTGAPKVQNKTVFVTSSRPAEVQGCGGKQDGAEGRLYGAHFTKVLSSSYLDPFGDRALRVVPMIPRYNQQGERIEDALSLILPPGRTAHGFSLVPTPSCSPGVSSVTELVLNLTEELNAGPNLLINGLSVEYIQGGFVAGQAVNGGGGQNDQNVGIQNLSKSDLNDALEVKMSGSLFTVSLSPGSGDEGGTLYSPVSPFPSKVLYWGSGDEE